MSCKVVDTPTSKSRLSKSRRKSGLRERSKPRFDDQKKYENGRVLPEPLVQSLVSVQKNEESSPSSSPKYFRNYEALTSSPFHIPNSQAPIPGKEVYWDFDTPQSRKLREAFVKKFEESNSPISLQKKRTPKLRMIPRPRQQSSSSAINAKMGEEAMEELLLLCRETEERQKQMEQKDKIDGSGCESTFERLSMNVSLTSASKSDLFEGDSDLFDGESGLFDGQNSFKMDEVEENQVGDIFDDNDDSFLLQASQAAESRTINGVVENKTATKKEEPTVIKDYGLKKPPNPVINTVKSMDNSAFGSEDDSFDEFLSQMDVPSTHEESPSSPILRNKRKCFELSSVPKETASSRPLSVLNGVKSGLNKSRSGNFVKHSSLDIDSQKPRKTISRIKSDPFIQKSQEGNKKSCSIEEINRKKQMALERRRLSQLKK